MANKTTKIESYLNRCITRHVDYELLRMGFTAREIFDAVCNGFIYLAPVGTELEHEDDSLSYVDEGERVYIITCN